MFFATFHFVMATQLDLNPEKLLNFTYYQTRITCFSQVIQTIIYHMAPINRSFFKEVMTAIWLESTKL